MKTSPWPASFTQPKNPLARIIIIAFVISWMAVYPIYTSYYKANAVEHYLRHKDHVAGNSMFFNPWQYRILCPLIIEGMYWLFDHTIYKVVEIKGVSLGLPGEQQDKNPSTQKLIDSLQNPEFIKYTIVFLVFRFLQNATLLVLCFYYFSLFVRSKPLIVFGLMVATLFMGNSVVDSDLTFNTYMDITLYILAGIVIVKGFHPAWIILLTFIGILNRETSAFIPVIYFFSKFKWSSWPSIPALIKDNGKVILITSVSAICFLSLFYLIRLYYGFQPVSSWRVSPGWPMLKLNLFSAVSIKTYMEMFGVLGLLPIWMLLVFSKVNIHLKRFFLILVPVWFALHLAGGIAYQTRLFLVPTLLVFLPAVLENLERPEKQDDEEVERLEKATVTA